MRKFWNAIRRFFWESPIGEFIRPFEVPDNAWDFDPIVIDEGDLEFGPIDFDPGDLLDSPVRRFGEHF